MKEITINLKFIDDCMSVVSKEESRYFLMGVLIKDTNGMRQYVGTNGHILVFHQEEALGENIDTEIILKPLSKIKIRKKSEEEDKYGILQIIDHETALIRSNNQKIACDIIDGTYPDFEKIIPNQETEEATKYIKFNPSYMRIVDSIIGPDAGAPQIAEDMGPCLWEKDDCKVVLMPMRI